MNDQKALRHFVQLARNGKHPGASSGAQSARQLAECVLENAPALDDSAIAGLIEFVCGAKGAPESARALIEPAKEPTPRSLISRFDPSRWPTAPR